MKTSNDDGSSFIVRDPASRLAAAGLEVFPLCDETLRRPNAAAARHFPATCAAVRAAGGFGARLWVLSPDTKMSRTHREVGFSRGVSDGYWRAHVVLDADEAETDTTFSFAERTTLGDFAGIRAGDEIRRAEIGDLIVVNDAFEKRWFHENKNKTARAENVFGANKSSDASDEKRETKSERRGDKRNVARPKVGAAVVLTFDVLRPEHAACRVLYVRHKARLVREVGERNSLERTWRSLALAVLGNLS